ncbi:hypothetical protein G9A89_022999 [Geosiphon pyriformis]|nr:hypothetical protein G9A89_022999 [Geosiphon pyriformis]
MNFNPQLKVLISFLLSLFLIYPLTTTAPVRPNYNVLVVFGDSYSDNGNTGRLTGGKNVPNFYDQGRYCNGPVWPEYLATIIGATLSDFAYGVATSDSNVIQGIVKIENSKSIPVPGVIEQIDLWQNTLNQNTDFSKILVAVWHVGGDYVFSNFAASPSDVIPHIAESWERLYQIGVRNFLIPSLPDTSKLPIVKQFAQQKGNFFEIYVKHSNLLGDAIDKFIENHSDINLQFLDTNQIMTDLSDRAQTFGIFNTTDACADRYSDPPTECENPQQYFYWDAQHLTTKIHFRLAQVFADKLKLLSPFK